MVMEVSAIGVARTTFRSPAALGAIADAYDMHPAEVLQWVGVSALRDRLRRDKARAMMIDSAKMI